MIALLILRKPLKSLTRPLIGYTINGRHYHLP